MRIRRKNIEEVVVVFSLSLVALTQALLTLSGDVAPDKQTDRRPIGYRITVI